LADLPRTRTAILPVAVLFGGFLSTLYPVCVAHAHDRMGSDRVVTVSGRLILLSGVGSILGPLVAMGFMERFGIDGVLYMIAAVAALLALMAAATSLTSAPPRHVKRTIDILTPQAAILSQDPLIMRVEPSAKPG
jgi:MFS family permease